MTKHFLIYYRNVLVVRKLTRKGAEALAFSLIKDKGWDSKEVEVREDVF